MYCIWIGLALSVVSVRDKFGKLSFYGKGVEWTKFWFDLELSWVGSNKLGRV